MNIISGIILGLVQGLTEFLPISSSGHLILAREILGLQTADGLAVDAVLQLATILAVGIYFRRELVGLTLAAGKWLMNRPTSAEQRILLLAILIGTMPAVIFGLFLENLMDTVFRSVLLVTSALIIGSLFMLIAEVYARRRQPDELNWRKGLFIGLFQCLALIPGISRSGSTISGGLFVGLDRSTAARFSFLLSFPIIVGTGLKKLLDLSAGGELSGLGLSLPAAFLSAFFVGLIAIHFLLHFLRSHSLLIFIGYRLFLAAVVLGWLSVR
jgi:undecaprenyl-diphosphatase